VGKTEVSLELARSLGAEIVAMDSMTVYWGMDIGTAKASPAERVEVPHHLLDIVPPWDEFTIKDYLRLAEVAVRDILARDRVPLFVGGTGLYLRGLLRGLFDGPPADADIRHRWESFASREGAAALHQELARVDPTTAARLHPNDQRRIIRALEVAELTGRPLSEWQQESLRPASDRPANVFWLEPERDWLNARIGQRVRKMFAEGLLDEVERLSADPRGLSPTARQALGYKEVLDAWENLPPGERRTTPTMQQLMAEIELRTRQFAKRQFTWFRNLAETIAVPIASEVDLENAAEIILRRAGDVKL
jgi:tRNA dimethylallyltransferase